MSPAARKRLLAFAASAAGLAAVILVLYALAGGASPARARRVLTFALMMEGLAVALAPLFSAERCLRADYWRGVLATAAPVGWVLAVPLVGELILSLSADRGLLPALLLAKLVVAAAGLAFAGLVLVLVRLSRRPLFAAAAAGALALAFTLQPFYTQPAMSALSGEGRAVPRDFLVAAGVRSPLLAPAYVVARLAPVNGWQFLPHMAMYNRWVGNDYQVPKIGPGRYRLEYLAAAALLAALAAARRSPAASSGPKAPPC